MKKYIVILLITLLNFLIIPINVDAKTLGQLKQEYNELEAKINSINNSIKVTEEQMTAARNRVESIYDELAAAEKEIQNINAEITKLNEEIQKKDKETKELMKFFQLSKGESTYLEYIFSADSITDFIYRITVTEQLSKYNDKLIDEMHEMIDKNNKNIEELHKKEDSLKNLQKELMEKLEVLASERSKLFETSLSEEEELKAKKSILDYYVKSGCKDNEDISTCGGSDLPPGTKFFRPLSTGCITENYGPRICPFHGREIHSGMDMACGDRKVYSVSDGRVKIAAYGWNGGYGNYVIIHHYVNGKKYTSLYGHLASINVKQGDVVNKDTVVGIMGSTGNSTGTHLHLTMYNGLYLEPGESYSLTDPRNYINFPSYDGYNYSYFYNRTSYYK